MIVALVVGVLIAVCLYVHSSFAIILIGKRELVAFMMSRACCVVLPRGAMRFCLRFVIVVFHDHTHLLFLCCTLFVGRHSPSK